MAEQRRRKAINFDLNTATLRQLFGEAGRRKAYSGIGQFLKKNGFEHRQGSGYRSIGAFSEAEINDIVISLYEAYPWMIDAVRKLDVTNIGRDYDMHAIAVRQIERKRKVNKRFDVV